MNPYTILPLSNRPRVNGPLDEALSVYVYKAVTYVYNAVAAVAEWVVNTVNAVRAWHTRHAAIGELSRLSDHLLKDIGIDRSEIRTVVDGMLRRPPAWTHRSSPFLHVTSGRARPAATDNDYADAA